MRTKWVSSLMVIVLLMTGVSMVAAEVIRHDIVFEERPVVVLLPKNYDKGNDLIPLILHLHGAIPLEDARIVEMENSGYDKLPSKYRVMVVAPQAGLNPVRGVFEWNSFLSLVGCGFTNEDDVGFLNSLLDKLIDDYPVDPKRVYIYGYSSGGAMAHRMACENPERFAGIVAGAGFILDTLESGLSELCEPSEPVPISVLQFHSTGDGVVLFGGGNFGDRIGDPGNENCNYPGAIELSTQWADLNGCVGEFKSDKKPKYDLTTPGYADPPGIAGGVEGKETTVHRFKQCPNGIDVELWTLSEGVPHPPLFYHYGPNGIKTLAQKSWEFLRRHKRGDAN
jgi:poly(3-hydroxybutyrate) depolymerase